MFPADGYKILEPPATYQPIRTPSRRLLATPTPAGGMGGFEIQLEDRDKTKFGLQETADSVRACLAATMPLFPPAPCPLQHFPVNVVGMHVSLARSVSVPAPMLDAMAVSARLRMRYVVNIVPSLSWPTLNLSLSLSLSFAFSRAPSPLHAHRACRGSSQRMSSTSASSWLMWTRPSLTPRRSRSARL